MKLGELFAELSYIEFSNLTLGGEGSGQIPEARWGQLVTSTNEAMLELHKRFQLLERELVVQALSWRTLYPLRVEYAKSNATPDLDKFIIDAPGDLFTGDLIHITGVRDERGCVLPMNDSTAANSAFTPAVDVLQLVQNVSEMQYFVTYRASHPKLIFNPSQASAALDQEITIPLALKAALRQKIAANMFTSMGGQEYTSQAQAFEMKYQASCGLVDQENLAGPTEANTLTKLESRGFI